MDWPIFYKDELKLGNPNSLIGVCTLWTNKKLIHNKLSDDQYCVCGNLYTIQGINPLLKNILAKPTIKYIILCGVDLMQSGDSLIKFVENGVDDERKIIGSSGMIDSNIDREHIESFRQNVKIIDLRGRENELQNKINELAKSGEAKPFADPVFITKNESPVSTIVTDEAAFKVRGQDIGQVWLRILDVIMKFGEEKMTEYHTRQKEIIDLISVVEGDSEKMPPWLKLTEKDLENYYTTFFGKEKPEGVTYTYGNRLKKYELVNGNFVDQIESAANYLKRTPYTRRAIAVTWKMEVDRQSQEPPCITQITWNIRNGKLYQTAIIRSNDMFHAWPLNAYALRKMQKEIAEKVGVKVGDLITISNSGHLYENDWSRAKEILADHYSGKKVELNQDRNGYFVIRVENEKIVVEFLTNDGLPTGHVFRGAKGQDLYKEIINENLVSRMDHAAYLGYDLAKAEAALKENKKFIQDEA